VRFTLRQLEYFVAVGESGSITQAAQRVNISQPSISAAITHLEIELGVQLFVRHHAQGLSLTPAGRTLLDRTKEVLQQAEALLTTADTLASKVSGRIDVGILLTLAPLIIPEICRSFEQKFAGTRVHVAEDHQGALLARLRNAEISIAVTYDLGLPDDVAFEPLACLPPYVLLSGEHPLARQKAVSLQQLAKEPFILLDLPLSRDYFMELFQTQKVEPEIRERSQFPDVVRSLVARGHGYSILNVRPRNIASLDGLPLAYVNLAGTHRVMQLGIATVKDFRRTALSQAFEAHCRGLITTTLIPGTSPALPTPYSEPYARTGLTNASAAINRAT
jgi:DNA-binding transcriptional LysR family regulator